MLFFRVIQIISYEIWRIREIMILLYYMSIDEYNNIKGANVQLMEELFKSLGDENRLRILNLLIQQQELCVCELEVLLEMTQSNVSRHLSKLKTTGIISSSKDAQWVYYKINPEFKKENELLYRYLKEKFQENSLFIDDIERYKKYKEHNINCHRIKDDKKYVLKILTQEVLIDEEQK